LLNILADGHFHSGTELGEQLGVSRAAVWKQVRRLQSEWGLEVFAVRGRGYRLAEPLEPLAQEKILDHLPNGVRNRVSITVCASVDSTSRVLMDQALTGAVSGSVCFAEHQTAGRGRRGRQWVSPFGANLYFSLLWRWSEGAATLSGLSLALGVALARALRDFTPVKLEFKWPNDLLCQGQKLGGVLLDMRGEGSGPCTVVIGIGLNVRMPAAAARSISQPWVDLETLAGRHVARNELAAALLTQVVAALDAFRQSGLQAFRDEWLACDRFKDSPVELQLPDRVELGIERGIDESGALLLEQNGRLHRFLSGEISLRSREV
jgi:BirA family biotin operon repressor/biotin-[acetyl-CoA-carboxylase] ligase